jgi:hypothetical protein
MIEHHPWCMRGQSSAKDCPYCVILHRRFPLKPDGRPWSFLSLLPQQLRYGGSLPPGEERRQVMSNRIQQRIRELAEACGARLWSDGH